MTDEKALWYVVHTYSGYENKVANDLVKTVENNGMSDLIQDVTVPIEEIVEIRNGKPHTIQHKLFPGYVLVKMIKTTETWYIVRNTRGVTGFVGPGSEPIPLTDEEFERMTSCQGTIRVDLEPGDSVRIKTGSVENAIGTVEEINAEEYNSLTKARNLYGENLICLPRQYVNTERKSVAAQRLFGFHHHDLRQFLRQLQKNLLLI